MQSINGPVSSPCGSEVSVASWCDVLARFVDLVKRGLERLRPCMRDSNMKEEGRHLFSLSWFVVDVLGSSIYHVRFEKPVTLNHPSLIATFQSQGCRQPFLTFDFHKNVLPQPPPLVPDDHHPFHPHHRFTHPITPISYMHG